MSNEEPGSDRKCREFSACSVQVLALLAKHELPAVLERWSAEQPRTSTSRGPASAPAAASPRPGSGRGGRRLFAAEIDHGFFPHAAFPLTTCPDGNAANDTADTCLRVRVRFTNFGWGEYLPNTFTVGGPQPDEFLYAMLYAAPRFFAGSTIEYGYGPGPYTVGPTGTEAPLITGWETCGLDQDQDGNFCDIGYAARLADAQLPLGTSDACVSGTAYDGQRVWGCTEVVVNEYSPPPISPPASPPASPPRQRGERPGRMTARRCL